MNLKPVLKKYRGVIITKPENICSVSDILHLDPSICYASGANVHEYDALNRRLLTNYPHNPIVICFTWFNDQEMCLWRGVYNEQEQQYYIKDIELLERFSKPIILINT